ncbi:riboflavin synthase [Nocardia miyunensis]|uniref:riboflavin synthase n=1 Tax=Nocardia miyunensis TaxID=282684 RepID=UPI00083027B6|nr:riboflavin synthase [Nocardia miyunensis]
MFTGIVEELGEIVAAEPLADAARLTIRGKLVTSDARHGDSIAVNGVCLTVVDIVDGDSFTTDVMGETLNRSGIGKLDLGAKVNLERAAAVDSRLGGHIVQGHVDGTGTIVSRSPQENWEVVRVSVPDALARYIVEKGSITIDGISLTVSGIGTDTEGEPGHLDWLEVSLIPTTRELTTLGSAPVGTTVNLEVDIIAKYVERLMQRG